MGLYRAGFALLFALIVSNSVLPASCSLAAYSETRSFRDALEGRSMEEAISGPVDKDTSSYGDRTAQSPASSMDAQNGQAGSGGQMMLNIPANGNLNQQQQQPIEQTDQQKTSYTGPELEREAGPVNGMQPVEQQMMMEQKAARMRSSRPSMAERLMAMGPQRNARQQQTEQQTTEGYPTGKASGKSSGFGDEQAGEQPYGSKQQPDSQQQSTGGAEEKQPAGEQRPMGYGAEDEQQQQSAGGSKQPPMMTMMNGADMGQQQEQEKGYGGAEGQQMLAKQRAMAAMLMSMNSGMKYSRNGQQQMGPMMMNAAGASGGQYGDKKQTSMAQNMMMSLANKAAYMQRSQRQMAPPMMMTMNGAGGSYTTGKPKAMMAAANYKQQASPMSAMLMNGASPMGAMRAMRRANQRRTNEKKMSPAMVNAMLNKMVSMKQQQMASDQSYGSSMKPASAMAMLMKSSAGAEMLANMMMPQMAGAMSDMPAAKREQYKRMMMATLMQQQQTSEMPNDEPQQQMTDAYGKPAMEKGAMSGKSMGGYGAGSSTMSPMAMMMNMMSPATGYEGQQQQQMADSYGQSKKGAMSMPMSMSIGGKTAGDYAPSDSQQQMPEQQQMMKQPKSMDAGYGSGQEQQKEMMMMNNNGYGSEMDQQQRQMPTATESSYAGKGMMSMNGKGAYGAQTTPMMMSMRPTMPSALGNGKYGMEQTGEGMEQQKKMMSTYDMMDQQQKKMMNGNGYGSEMDQQQRQMPAVTESSYSMDSKDSPAMQMGSGKGMSMRQAYMQQAMGAGSEKGYMAPSPAASMAPMGTKGGQDYSSSTAMPAKGYDQQMDQQQQQQQESDYGAAPMGQAEPFAFDYKIEDDYGNGQYRKEESDKNGVVRGSYGYMDNSGIYRHVEYVADENGFRANIKSNEPGLSSETGASKTNGGSGAGSMDSQMAAGNYGDADQQQMMSPPGNAMDAAAGNGEGKTNANSNSNNYMSTGNTQQQMMSPAGQTQMSGDSADIKKKA